MDSPASPGCKPGMTEYAYEVLLMMVLVKGRQRTILIGSFFMPRDGGIFSGGN